MNAIASDTTLPPATIKAVCKQMAKAIKNIDAAISEVYGGDSPTANTLRSARLPLIVYILAHGYELEMNTYRLLRAQE
uniref:Uncharacterized protein n=1 Tax=viral metagenome TaxID=1070528 RepID=A0A6M3JKD7_9ZZZZ